MEWEDIDNYHKRCSIPGGWLVKAYEDVFQKDTDDTVGYDWRMSMCFVPDPLHEWKIGA